MAGGNQPYDGRRFGRALCAAGDLARHRHAFGYVCVVLAGRFVEAGDAGRFRVAPGHALVHRPFEAHLDLFGGGAAEVLNLPLPTGLAQSGAIRIGDLDRMARLAERDPREAAEALAEDHCGAEAEADWPDLLAAELRSGAPFALGAWARRHGLAPASVSRGFRQAYGVPPARFRSEARARRAWQSVRDSRRPLADIACEAGFADQPHMTRAISTITGAPPQRWRRGEVNSVQDGRGRVT